MAQFQNDDLEYIVDDYYDMSEFEEDPFSESETPRNGADSDFEDDFDMRKPKTDTSAVEVRNGKDIQGIPWERLNYTRDKYRETRLRQYKNYESLSRSREDLDKLLKAEYGTFFDDDGLEKGSEEVNWDGLLSFVVCTLCRGVQGGGERAFLLRIPIQHQACQIDNRAFSGRDSILSSLMLLCMSFLQLFLFIEVVFGCIIVLPSVFIDVTVCSKYYTIFSCLVRSGFLASMWNNGYLASWFAPKCFCRLRNLLWATSKHDVYLMQNYSLMHWSSLLRRAKELLNVAKPVNPTLNNPRSLAQSLARVQISTMAVKDDLWVAGGFHGELICKYLNQSGVVFCTKLTTEENAITNTVDIYRNPSGMLRIMAANNDAQVRVFDAENFACLDQFSFSWSVNNISVSPDGKLLAVLGDSSECLLADAQSGKVIGNLRGHLDYSFASSWHPDGRILATGNQDTTCRLWDVRNPSQSLAVLKGRMGAIRAVRFTSDGQFLAMAEPADFVHIFNSRSGYAKEQEIDLFGEIAGISFSPDTEALFVGVADRTYGSLLEFNRKRCHCYLDSIL
ncbi:WD40 repeat [Dillenia turbinata]|uniref:WD40 repeat n=1 Tax=Dillenia turbinata TaxID=194707 RepID=A0AAN8W1E5_9MAGN